MEGERKRRTEDRRGEGIEEERRRDERKRRRRIEDWETRMRIRREDWND